MLELISDIDIDDALPVRNLDHLDQLSSQGLLDSPLNDADIIMAGCNQQVQAAVPAYYLRHTHQLEGLLFDMLQALTQDSFNGAGHMHQAGVLLFPAPFSQDNLPFHSQAFNQLLGEEGIAFGGLIN